MTQQPDPADASPALPALKIVEPRGQSPPNPWVDDKLDREKVAKRLTSIVRGQKEPFVISLDGRWGTGKTFLLKRWAAGPRRSRTRSGRRSTTTPGKTTSLATH